MENEVADKVKITPKRGGLKEPYKGLEQPAP